MKSSSIQYCTVLCVQYTRTRHGHALAVRCRAEWQQCQCEHTSTHRDRETDRQTESWRAVAQSSERARRQSAVLYIGTYFT